MDVGLSKNLDKPDSGARTQDSQKHQCILPDFFRPGNEWFFQFDMETALRWGRRFKDYIAPTG